MAKGKTYNRNRLTKREQSTPVAYKLLSTQNKSLKLSLRKTQDELEKLRQEKTEIDKNFAVLQHKAKSIFWIEFAKFSSSAGIGFATNYVFSGSLNIALSIGIPSLLVFLVSLLFSNK
jgi:hypothetical protein